NSQKYGGGAIYNWYGISAAHIFSRPESIRKTYAHEFGHLFLGLGDEYVEVGNDTDMYDLSVEPWEENLTALVGGKCKWADLIDKKTPVPTPAPKGYDRAQTHQMSEWQLGAYEGGGYLEKGIYRPMPNCMMNWMHTQDLFCPVCDRAIRKYTDFLTK
ncbi:MAG: peptidase M64, partial [Bacteroidaceae bacterium]|nr:peptidase M64 [Bacteroidaceae bacterium]